MAAVSRKETLLQFTSSGVVPQFTGNGKRAEPYMVTFREGDHRLIPQAQSDPETFYRAPWKTSRSRHTTMSSTASPRWNG